MSENSGTWVYAATAGIGPASLSGLTGVSGQRVRAVTAGGLAAAVSTVSLAEFGEQPLRAHLEDLSWLERTARAHHHVIAAVAADGPIVPMRLATIFHDDALVAAMLRTRQADLAAALDRVTARAEWGVKVYGASGSAAATTGPDEPGAGPGTSYLRRRRAQLSAAQAARKAEAAAANAVHAALSSLAVAAQLRPLQVPELAGETEPMILNATYLVDDIRSAEFSGRARELAERSPQVRIELTGPWPPYSFAVTDVAGAPG